MTDNEPWRLGAAELARRIARGELTASGVVAAHIGRIEDVNPRINALVYPTFDAARKAATLADERQRSGEPLGPLHGVPCSIKDCFDVAGTPSTIGISRFAAELAANDGQLVQRLRAAGGIVLGKTNVPQLMLIYETDNPVYGVTKNPWDVSRSPGGSSGGESALVAAGGSPLGLGTDLGGSIRQPAHSCGIHGFLPTPGMMSTAGMRTNLPGFDAIQVQPGLLARHVEDIELAMQVTASPPWRKAAGGFPQLRIGYFEDDGYFTPSPAIRRAVREAAEALRAGGASVEAFEPPSVNEAVYLFFALLSADGGDGFRELLGNSPRDPRIARLLRLGALPGWLQRIAVTGSRLLGRKRLADILERVGRRTPEAFQKLVQSQVDYRSQFDRALAAQALDVLICPPCSIPALTHGASDSLRNCASYCLLMNVLGFPCGVVAATTIGPNELSDRTVTRDPSDRAAWSVEQGSAGLPVGVQVAAPPGQDGRVLAVMAFLEQHFRGKMGFPQTPVS